MVEQQPSKLNTRVRFPSPAPASACCLALERVQAAILGRPSSRVPKASPDPRQRTGHGRRATPSGFRVVMASRLSPPACPGKTARAAVRIHRCGTRSDGRRPRIAPLTLRTSLKRIGDESLATRGLASVRASAGGYLGKTYEGLAPDRLRVGGDERETLTRRPISSRRRRFGREPLFVDETLLPGPPRPARPSTMRTSIERTIDESVARSCLPSVRATAWRQQRAGHKRLRERCGAVWRGSSRTLTLRPVTRQHG